MINKYQKGARLERKVIHDLEEKGWFCVRSAGSKGALDIVAFKGDDRLFIQAKNNGKPLSLKEWNVVFELALAHVAIPIFAGNIKGKTQYLAILAKAFPRKFRESSVFNP
jgi:Holliday junction resolvase